MKPKRYGKTVMYINVLRRKLVNLLLGNELILQRINTPSGYAVELVDVKWRLNFGRWYIKQVNDRDFKLTR